MQSPDLEQERQLYRAIWDSLMRKNDFIRTNSIIDVPKLLPIRFGTSLKRKKILIVIFRKK